MRGDSTRVCRGSGQSQDAARGHPVSVAPGGGRSINVTDSVDPWQLKGGPVSSLQRNTKITIEVLNGSLFLFFFFVFGFFQFFGFPAKKDFPKQLMYKYDVHMCTFVDLTMVCIV